MAPEKDPLAIEVICPDGTASQDRNSLLDAVWSALALVDVDVGTTLTVAITQHAPGELLIRVSGSTSIV
jgi:hypothetical protein